MQSTAEKSKFGSDRSPMSEKHDQSPRGPGNGTEREPERRGWQTTFDVYVGRIPPDWTKVCAFALNALICCVLLCWCGCMIIDIE